MGYLLGRHVLDDVEGWKKMMESHRQGHLQAGLHFQQVWSNADNPREIFFLFKVDDLNKAKSFLKEAGALDPDKQARGEVPTLFFLDSR
ncbi:MAG: hypothetical protein HY308_01850 [Gammaproteobacteria bacterium]|nr:hypothetical protein [Gammaproteobacteria bacterium]